MYHRDRHGRDENSLLFDLDALMAEGDPSTPLPFDAAPARPPAAPPIAPLVPLVPAPRRPRWLTALAATAIALGGGVALAAAGGIAYTLSIQSDVAEDIAEPAVTRVAVGQTPPARPVDDAPPVEPSTPPEPVAPPADTSPDLVARADTAPGKAPARTAQTRSKTVKAARAPQVRTPKTRDLRQADTEDRPEAPPVVATASPADPRPDDAVSEVDALLGILDAPPAPRGNPEPPAVREVPIALPDRLTRRQILHVARRTGPKMNRCPGDGRYSVELRILPAGRVEVAGVRGDDPAVRACVERHARTMVFPRFGGDPMTIDLPFML